ncbi:hypothetical protein CVS40_6305 [Lucilia cuprina]|nr:hypothetical protein CVS40_6305 [Lucilia cuprina]
MPLNVHLSFGHRLNDVHLTIINTGLDASGFEKPELYFIRPYTKFYSTSALKTGSQYDKGCFAKTNSFISLGVETCGFFTVRCRLQIHSSIGSETLWPNCCLASRIKTLMALFAQTIDAVYLI